MMPVIVSLNCTKELRLLRKCFTEERISKPFDVLEFTAIAEDGTTLVVSFFVKPGGMPELNTLPNYKEETY